MPPTPRPPHRFGKFRRVEATDASTALMNVAKRRRLTHAEVVAYLEEEGTVQPSYKRFRPRTQSKDDTLMMHYRRISEKDDLTKGGIKFVLTVIVEQQRHLCLIQERLKEHTAENRPMTFDSFRFNWVNGFYRLWYKRFRGKRALPRSLAYDMHSFLTEAASFMPGPYKAPPLTTESSYLLMKALPQGSKHFLRDAFMISLGDEHAQRTGSVNDIWYGDIVSVKEVTAAADKGDPRKRLVEVMLYCGSTKKQLMTACNPCRLIGNPFVDLGVLDSVQYLNAATKEDFGIELLDEKTGVTIVSLMKKKKWQWLRRVPLYYQSSSGLARVYKSAAANTDLPPDVVLTPRCHRVGFYSRVTWLLESGTLSAANTSALQLAMRHTLRSSIGRSKYLDAVTSTSAHFASSWSKNPSLRNRPVHQPLPTTVKEQLNLDFEPRVLNIPDRRNLDIVRSMVRLKMRNDDYCNKLHKAGAYLPDGSYDVDAGVAIPPVPSSSRVAHKLGQLKSRYGVKVCCFGKSVGTEKGRRAHAEAMWLRTLATLTRAQMRVFVNDVIIKKYW